MKKIFAFLLCVCILSGTAVYVFAEKTEYELWVQSPTITSGLTSADMRIYKALDKDLLRLIPLDKVGKNYYLAVCEDKMSDGGYKNNYDTTQYYFYTIYATDDGFIVLSYASADNEYWQNAALSMRDITNEINSTHYRNNNSEVPYYIMNPRSKYTNLNITEYDEFFYITDAGKIYAMCEEVGNSNTGYPYISDGVLYRGQNTYKSSGTAYFYMEDGKTKASNSKGIYFKNGQLTYGTAIKVPVANMTEGNGYIIYNEEFESNITFNSYIEIPGSNNLFFVASNERTLNTTDNKNYYYHKLDIYKSNKGEMTYLRTEIIPTKSTYSTSYTYQQINDIDENYYISKGLCVPSVLVGNIGVIGRDGTACALELDTSIYKNYYYFCTYKGRLAINRSCNGATYINKVDPADNRTYSMQVINEITFNSTGKLNLGSDIDLKIQSSPHEGQNGYFSSSSVWQPSNFTAIVAGSVKAWWGRTLNNVFPDGRYVTANWQGIGGGIYEVWYNVYGPDGRLRASGPTGSSTTFASTFETYDLVAWTVNDSKFVICVPDLEDTYLNEYYCVAVVEENEEGEIVKQSGMGEKTISPPIASDTEVVQSKIDFGSSEIPLGYNIKDNVIDSGKLDAMLREQVNSVRLNDIVILAKNGYQSGEQNTGVTLNSYSSYDYSFGSSYVRLYTNGQYFRWYCNNPEDLIPGTYSKTITIGDKTIYVTFKVVDPPTNEGSTTVVF